MVSKLIATSLLFFILSLGSVNAGQEEYLTETERTKYSDAVFDGTVEQIAQVVVIDDSKTLWEATILLKSVVKGKFLTSLSRVRVYFIGPNGDRMVMCASLARIEPEMKARFNAVRKGFSERQRVLYIESDQWVSHKEAI